MWAEQAAQVIQRGLAEYCQGQFIKIIWGRGSLIQGHDLNLVCEGLLMGYKHPKIVKQTWWLKLLLSMFVEKDIHSQYIV